MQSDDDRLTHITTVAEQAAISAVERTLLAIGIDPSDKIKAQHEFGKMREAASLLEDAEFTRDMAHLRRWRLAMESVQSKGFASTVAFLVAALLGALWLGIQDLLRH
jgi:hypothetical protein